MDTNVKWEKGMWQGNSWVIPSADIRELCRRWPNVLIFPEFGRFAYWSACTPYGELRGGKTHTGENIREVYPQAGSVLAVSDGDYLGNWNDLRSGVVAGDIHLFCSWFPDRTNAYVQHMYQEADFVRRSATVSASGTLDELLKDADPLVRFVAVSRLAKPSGKEASQLIAASRTEKEWVIQRRIVEALGGSGDSAAVPVLVDLLKDPKSGLDAFAPSALARIGPPATPALLGLVADKNQRLARNALRALAESNDPAATATLLSLTGSPDASTRILAIRGLGQRPPSAEVTGKLTSLLDDKDAAVVIAASASLGKLKDRSAVKPLVNVMLRAVRELHNNGIREAAGDALEAITGRQDSVFEGQWEKALAEGRI
jgi:HEAT repeat protein